MAEITITKENFETEVLQSNEPVLVDFWASWCGPCRMLSPVIHEVAEDYKGQVKVGKINVDEQMELAKKYQIFSIPTVVLFKEGKVVKQSVGYHPKKEIVRILQ